MAPAGGGHLAKLRSSLGRRTTVHTLSILADMRGKEEEGEGNGGGRGCLVLSTAKVRDIKQIEDFSELISIDRKIRGFESLSRVTSLRIFGNSDLLKVTRDLFTIRDSLWHLSNQKMVILHL